MFWFISKSSKRSSKNNFYDFTAINNIVSITGSAIYVHTYSALYFFPLRKQYLKLKLKLLQKYTYLQLCIFLQKFRITQIVLCHFARRPRLQTMLVPFEKNDKIGRSLFSKPSLKIMTANAIFWISLGIFRDYG